MDDWQLLNDYATRNSEEAFHALVERYAGMVYHTALRQLGNPHSAEEVAQAVFIILAQKAAKIRRQTTLYGWLFRATRFAVLNQRRQEKNRARREQEAYAMQSASNSDDLNPVWEQITPHLDDALDKLPVMDRELVMIRYFGNKSHKEAAQTLGLSEDVVRKRLSRAMEKLRVIFVRRGVAVSSLALVTAFTAHGVQAAPLGLASSLAGVAVTKGATASGSTLTLIKGALKIMAWTKAKTAIIVGASVLLAAGTTTVTVKRIEAHKAEASWRVPFPDPERAPSLVEILPTKFPASVDTLNGGSRGDNWIGVGQSVFPIVQIAYDWRPGRILFADPQPKERYDFISTLRQGSGIALQAELKRKLGLVGHREMRDTDVLVLKVRRSNAPGLKPPTNGHTDHTRKDYYYCDNEPLSIDSGGASSGGYSAMTITSFLEGCFGTPVIDQTGLTQHFHIDFKWNERSGDDPDHDALKQALLDQLGLELVPSNMPVEMLVVEKVK
jgi:uncharacterized protein (TIGR03435 family)